MKTNRNPPLISASKQRQRNSSRQNSYLVKLGNIFKKKFDPDTSGILWQALIERSENFDVIYTDIECFFSHHSDFLSKPSRWEKISQTQDLLSLEEGIKYLNSFINMGEQVYMLGLHSFSEFGELIDHGVNYDNFCKNAQYRVWLLKVALKISKSRGVSQTTDIERLVLLCGSGGITKVSTTEVIDKEYGDLDNDIDRRDFLEHLIAQLCPHNKTEYRLLLYNYLSVLVEVCEQVERKRIISTVNPKKNGAYILNKVSPYFKNELINFADEEEVKREGIKINEILALKIENEEKLLAIKALLTQYQSNDTLVSRILSYWLKLEWDALSDTPQYNLTITEDIKSPTFDNSISSEKREKIRWEKSEAGLVYWFELLYRDRAISQSTYDKRFLFMETLFENKNGMPFKRRQSLQAETNSKNNNNPKHKGKPREAPQLDKIAAEWTEKFEQTNEN